MDRGCWPATAARWPSPWPTRWRGSPGHSWRGDNTRLCLRRRSAPPAGREGRRAMAWWLHRWIGRSLQKSRVTSPRTVEALIRGKIRAAVLAGSERGRTQTQETCRKRSIRLSRAGGDPHMAFLVTYRTSDRSGGAMYSLTKCALGDEVGVGRELEGLDGAAAGRTPPDAARGGGQAARLAMPRELQCVRRRQALESG